MATPQHRPLPSPVDEPMTVSRPGLEPKQRSIADEADSAILAMDAIQAGDPNLGEEFIYAKLRDIRRLKQRLTAIEEELLLMAREPDDAGDKVSWRDLGEGIGQHHTTVKERHDRIAAGGTHSYRRWLTENTPRADLYPTS